MYIVVATLAPLFYWLFLILLCNEKNHNSLDDFYILPDPCIRACHIIELRHEKP